MNNIAGRNAIRNVCRVEQLNLIRVLVGFIFIFAIIFFVTIGIVVTITDNTQITITKIADVAEEQQVVCEVQPIKVEQQEIVEIAVPVVVPTVTTEVKHVVMSEVEIEDDSLQLYSLPINYDVHTITVDNIDINVDSLMACYYADNEYGTMNRDDNSTINTCINFLACQMGVSPEITAGIVGNVCVEGHFGEEQKTHKIATSVDEYIKNLLSEKELGYGIAQWTHESRQEDLVELMNDMIFIVMEEYDVTYEDAVYGDYYPTVIILSELVHLYTELQEYDIFDSLYDYHTLEDATGRIALLYERYKNCKKQWKYDEAGCCKLVGNDESSGAKRLNFAYLVYNKLNVD